MSQCLETSVKKVPGWTALTRTVGPKAWAKPIVSASRPAFAAAYGITSGSGYRAATLETLMMLPPSPCAIRVPIAAVRRNGPPRLTSMTLRQSSSETPSMRSYSGDMPALLTSTSTRPKVAYAASTSASSSSQRAT